VKGLPPGRVEGSSRAMLATARPSCFTIVGGTAKHCIDQYMFLFRYCWQGGAVDSLYNG